MCSSGVAPCWALTRNDRQEAIMVSSPSIADAEMKVDS
jgi:hypothetical protein